MTQKTNAVRLLDQLGIKYELRSYEIDPNDLTAESVAEKVLLPPEQVFKTLVARGDRNGICMAVIPGDAELDLKALANASGDRKIHLVQMKELLGLTGYIRGGVTALPVRRITPFTSTKHLSCLMSSPSQRAYVVYKCCSNLKIICG